MSLQGKGKDAERNYQSHCKKQLVNHRDIRWVRKGKWQAQYFKGKKKLSFALQQILKEDQKNQCEEYQERKTFSNNSFSITEKVNSKVTSTDTNVVCLLPTKLIDIRDLKERAIKVLPSMTIIGPINSQHKHNNDYREWGSLHKSEVMAAADVLNDGNAHKFLADFLMKDVDAIYKCGYNDRNLDHLVNFMYLSGSYKWRTLLFGLSLLKDNEADGNNSNNKTSYMMLLFETNDGNLDGKCRDDEKNLLTVKIHIKDAPRKINKIMELIDTICQRKTEAEMGNYLGLNECNSHSSMRSKHNVLMSKFPFFETSNHREKFESIWNQIKVCIECTDSSIIEELCKVFGSDHDHSSAVNNNTTAAGYTDNITSSTGLSSMKKNIPRTELRSDNILAFYELMWRYNVMNLQKDVFYRIIYLYTYIRYCPH